jgi:spermidine/putrescine transport system substrate-binding protein
LPAAVRDNPVMYPSPAVLANGEYSLDIGEAVTVYAKYWERLKVGE